jgi:hypothetical protein
MASIAVKAEMQHLPPFMQKRIKVAKFIKQTPTALVINKHWRLLGRGNFRDFILD